MAKRILVVDDDQDIVEIYRRSLERESYEVICAYDGEEGLKILRANPCDLLVLDLKMPKMSGDQVLRVIRRDPDLNQTKVLVMSSVLYRYKELPHGDRAREGWVKRHLIPDGLSRMGRRVQETDPLAMGAKTEPYVEMLYGMTPESEANFEMRVSHDLLKRVKEIFGEPYEQEDERKYRQKYHTVVAEGVKDLIARYLNIDKAKIYYGTSFKDELGAVFADAIPLRKAVEKKFDMRMSDDDQVSMLTVGNLIQHIESKKGWRRTSHLLKFRDEAFEELSRAFIFLLGTGLFAGLVYFLWMFLSEKMKN